MKSPNKKFDHKQKSKELFELSNQLFTTAKQLSEYHAAELKSGMAYALSYAQTAASKDMAQLKALQVAVTSEATKRMVVYHKKVKTILDQMGSQSPDKHLKEARTALIAWYKDAKKKLPQGAEQLGQVAHDVADAGIRAFKEGRKLVIDAADAAEKSAKKAAKKETNKAKKVATTPKKPRAKKQVVKKAPVKKVVARKVPVKKSPHSATLPIPELPD